MKTLINLCFLLSLSFSAYGTSDEIIEIVEDQRQLVKDKIFYLKDNEGNLDFKDVRYSNEFKIAKKGVPNFSISNATYWFRLTLSNQTPEPLFLELAHPVLNEVAFFDPTERGDSAIIDGQNIPFSEKKGSFTNIVFDLKLKTGAQKTYFFKIKSRTQIQFPIYVSSKENIGRIDHLSHLFAALFAGIMLAMIFYNISIYFIVKDKSYLYYVAFVAVILVVQLVPKGFASQYLWPESPEIANAAMFLSPALSGIASILFFNQFLKTKFYAPLIRKIVLLFVATYFIGLLFYLFNSYSVSYTILDLTSLSASVVMLVGAIVVYRRGHRSALFFLIAWSLFLLGVIVFVMKEVGVLPYNNFTNYTMMIGAGLETILLSIGLADMINVYKKEKEIAKENELTVLRENDLIIKESNIQLEGKVKERTKALEKVNEELNQTLFDLQNAQEKLIESEKMASLGHLTAGVAHEINNPINFVFSNITPLKRDLEDLKDVLDLYKTIDLNNFNERVVEIQKLKKDIDYEYVIKELDDLIMGIEEGARRTGEIVKGLRVFSRIDDEDMITCQINEGLESTVMLLNNKLDGLDLNVDLDENLPPTLCYPGKLNQTFMNLLTNAIDAVQDKFKGKPGGIVTLKTDYVEEKSEILISISDNGKGIPDALKNKIYDPFFTTKAVGKGTGLGLSISYKIIDSHEGRIELETKENEGTKFIIHLPVK